MTPPSWSLAAPLACVLSLGVAAQEFRFEPGDRVCLLGTALAERMQHDGFLETELQLALPHHGLVVRNLGYGGDALIVHQRVMNFGKMPEDDMMANRPNTAFAPWDAYLDRCDASVVLAFFGFNESFDGEEGLPAFREDLERFVAHVTSQAYDGEAPPRLVLCASIPFEDLGDPSLPDGREHNARIEAYNAVMRDVASGQGVAFVDLYAAMAQAYETIEGPLTINGIHPNATGNAVLAHHIANELTDRAPGFLDLERAGPLREAVVEKNELWFNRYRATDGYNTYGGRSRERYPRSGPDDQRVSNYLVLQREMERIEVMCANRDARIHALARGVDLAVDDSSLPPAIAVETNIPGPLPGGLHRFESGRSAIDKMTVAPGMQVNLFADEERFPELVNPVQMAWDTRGRLWVACWPSYPHWAPGEPFEDKLLILEDTDGDGEADTSKVFAGDLHNPTGFEFWGGGVVVAEVPDLVFLRDTDGDDVYDEKTRLLHGISSGDTHHSANSFVVGPNGGLYFQEGTFHFSQIESVNGPVRNHNGCVWRFDPRTWSVERYIPYNYANPHGHVFERWGQDFMTDGTGNVNYYALPFSGWIQHPAKHTGYFPFFQQRSRPCAGTEILSSSHFPEENQQSYLIANVIGFQGIFQYRLDDSGSGFGATELDPIVQSTDRNFRPTDIEVGPDGALYFVDWHNQIVGHLQHHIRDPQRNETHGRVYRVTATGRPLVEEAPIHGRPVTELVKLLASPEDRVRYRTRLELSGRDSAEVVAAARAWADALDAEDPDHDHHLLEALWLTQQHDRVDLDLLERTLTAEDPRARAAATRTVRYGRHRVPGALDLLRRSANDEHPRVRLEAVVAASAFDSAEAAGVALEVLRHPTDKYLDYGLGETMKALAPRWKQALRDGVSLVADNPAGVRHLLGEVGAEELASLPRTPEVLQAMLTRHGVDAATRREAAAELAAANGTTPETELLGAIRTIDQHGGAHAGHVLHELGMMLRGSLGGDASPPREALADLATNGRTLPARELGFGALVAADGDAEAAWTLARASAEGLRSFLGAVPGLDEAARASLADRVRPLMFSVPGDLAGEVTSLGGGGTGVAVEFYDPKPRRAALEDFEGFEPAETLTATHFHLDLPPANKSDRYALLFRGTLFAPASGRYSFWTNSDDGSMLYIDGRVVVSNDGDHGMRKVRGEVDLAAGPHEIVVTYYEQGGGHGLIVEWDGPGFDAQELPADALGSGGGLALRAQAIRAMAAVPAEAQGVLADAARLIGEPALLDPVMELVRSVRDDRLTPVYADTMLDTLAAYIAGLPPEQRTTPSILAAVEVAREIAATMPGQDGALTMQQFDDLAGALILVRTVPHQMLYDVEEFWVEAGQPVAIVFQNNDVMPHNLVITDPGLLKIVGQAAELLTEGDFVPDVAGVRHFTPLLYPGESVRLTFVAPEQPGDYPYVCTFPGHWRVMNGVMHVALELDDTMRVARRDPAADSAPAREFVKDWTVEDLAPLLADGWDADRDLTRGRALFNDAGCMKCHSVGGVGADAGPDLTQIAETYTVAELLTHVVKPSEKILEGYESTVFDLDDGTRVIGRVVHDDGELVHVQESLLEPDSVVELEASWIEDRWQTTVSAMPTGLLVTLTEEEVLDLLAYLLGGG